MGYVQELRALVGHRPLILVGSVVIVRNEEGKILLQQRRSPHGVWGLPGGLMELGESTEQVARREVYEETGLTLGTLSLMDVYSGEDQYSKVENGDEFYVVTTVYHTQEYSGILRRNEESLQLAFIDPEALPDRMVGSHRNMIQAFLSKQEQPRPD